MAAHRAELKQWEMTYLGPKRAVQRLQSQTNQANNSSSPSVLLEKVPSNEHCGCLVCRPNAWSVDALTLLAARIDPDVCQLEILNLDVSCIFLTNSR